MTLVRYEPWNALNQLHRQINRVFDTRARPRRGQLGATADWIPPADIAEYEDRLVLKLDVPGVTSRRSTSRSTRAC